jgi:hypothetical protein
VRRAVWIPLLSVVIGLAGCSAFVKGGGGDHPLKKVTRPISITLYQKDANSPCEARFSKRTHHAFKDDEIAWEFTNTCAADQTVTLSVKDQGSNPFTDSLPVTLSSIHNGDMADKTLTVSQSATTGTVYGFDIIVGSTKYDPRLEIDP